MVNYTKVVEVRVDQVDPAAVAPIASPGTFPTLTPEGHGVAFSFEHALELFALLPLGRLVLVVDAPRCRWVASAFDARQFFIEPPAMKTDDGSER